MNDAGYIVEMAVQAEDFVNLAQKLVRDGRPDDAIAAYRQALVQQPESLEICNTIAAALNQRGFPQEAIAIYRRALALDPDNDAIQNNLGLAYKNAGQTAEAMAAYEQASALRPDSPEPWNNLGNLFREIGNPDQAIVSYRQALCLRADSATTFSNLATALQDIGQIEEAIVCYQRALSLDPNSPIVHSNLVYALHFDPRYDAHAILGEHLLWNERHAWPLRDHIRPHTNDRSPSRRLRIGYVSPNFREHAVGRFLLPLLANHDHSAFEIFCYSDGGHLPDFMTNLLRDNADEWRNIAALSDKHVADLIFHDQIDILIDLTMHMAGNRLLVFARKPAPVQVTYLAYCSTTGMDTIDYRLTDPHLDPPGQGNENYSEQSIRLPRTYWCYQPADVAGDVALLPATKSGHFTFGCLNNFAKESTPCLAIWRRLLVAVPQSHLLLHAHVGSHRQRVQDFFAKEGINDSRLSFVDHVPLSQYFQLFNQIDVALDPFPYAGGTSTCDALWMGVPVVSLSGRTAVGRGGASILSNVGLFELLARDEEEYIQIAPALANDLPRLARIIQPPLDSGRDG